MSTASLAFAAYSRADICTISQKELILRLYQGLQRFLRTAQGAMRNRQIETAHINCQKSKTIISELLSTLNSTEGGEVATQLRSLYIWMLGEITKANLVKDPTLIDGVLPIVTTLEEAWQQIPEEHANISSVPSGNHGHAFNMRS